MDMGGLYVIITIIFYNYSILIIIYNSLSIDYTAKNIWPGDWEVKAVTQSGDVLATAKFYLGE